MSTEVATPLAPVIPTTTEETPILAPVVATGETKPQVEGGSSPSNEVPASEPTPVVATEEQPTTPTKEEHKKRSPFGDLKNKLFHKVSLSSFSRRGRRTVGSGKGLCTLEGLDYTYIGDLKAEGQSRRMGA